MADLPEAPRLIVLESGRFSREPDLAAALRDLGLRAESAASDTPGSAGEFDVHVVRDETAYGSRPATDERLRELARHGALVVLLESPDADRALELLRLGADEVLLPAHGAEQVALSARIALHRRRRARAAGDVERQLRAVVTDAPVVLWAVDMEGSFTLSEGRGLAGLGLRPGEVVGHSVFDLYAGWPDILASVRQALAGVSTRSRVEVEGNVFDTHCAPLRGEGGRIEGVMGVSTDVTELHCALRALERRIASEQILARISARFIQLAPDELEAGIYEALARLGELEDVDRAYVCTFDASGEHFENSHEWCAPGVSSARGDFQRVPTAYYPWLVARIRAGETVRVPRVSELPPEADDTRQGCEAQGVRSIICVPLVVGAGVLGFAGFVTLRAERCWTDDEVGLARMAADMLANALERRRSELMRAELEQELRRAQRLEALGTLAGGVAHDFNNLLTGILGHASLLRRRELMPDEVARAAEVIEAAAERAAGLTASLLGFARQEPPVRRSVDVHAEIREVLALLAHTLAERIEIEVDLAAEHHHVPGDPARIQQVVMNLLVNARDAVSAGGRVGIRTRVVDLGARDCERSSGLAPGRHLELCVFDTGPGVPPEIAERIFEPFFTTKPRGRGTGMGLATVYGAVQAHGGAVRVEQHPGGGALFRVHLPLYPGSPERGADIREDVPTGSGRILLVDDEELVRSTARTMLAALGYEVVEAPSAEAALERYAACPDEFDLVLLDLVMPGLGGLECLRRLRALDPSVRVLVSSGWDFGAADDLSASGIAGFVAKPYHLGRLAEVVRAALGAEPAQR